MQPSTTEKACVALLFIDSDDYILDNFFIFRMSQPIQLSFAHHNALHQLRDSDDAITSTFD